MQLVIALNSIPGALANYQAEACSRVHRIVRLLHCQRDISAEELRFQI